MINQFGLIIQETTAGSGQQFVSTHLDINSPEIKETITDERTLAAQLANLSDVYSVQVTKNYKVYSLIVTNLTDFLGRSGYYAIRLYGPKSVNLNDFERILATIKEKYINYGKSNTLNNQNYEDILSSILIHKNERNNIVSLKDKNQYFYYFDEDNSTLGTVFNTKGVHFVHKIYAFNKNKAVNESIALNSGLKSFTQTKETLKEIKIVNHDSILNDLKINDQQVDFNPNLSDFTLVCQNYDIVVYNAQDDKTFKTITNNFISIEKKFVSIYDTEDSNSSATKRKKKSNNKAIYLIVGLMVLLIGGGVFYTYFNPFGTEEKGVQETDNSGNTEGDTVNNQSKAPNEIEPEFDTTIDGKKYNEKLKSYVFMLKDKEWLYKNKNEPKVIMEFNQKTFNNNDFDLTEKEKKSFIDKLDAIINKKKDKEKNNTQNKKKKENSTEMKNGEEKSKIGRGASATVENKEDDDVKKNINEKT
jgi:hypothetical protein